MGVDIQLESVSFLSTTPGQYTIDLKTVSVDQDISLQQTTAAFDVIVWGEWNGSSWTWPQYTTTVNGQTKSVNMRPRAGNEVVFLNASGQREFGGILLSVQEEEKKPGVMVYHCTCGDYTKWFDRHLVNANYAANISVHELITDIVNTYVNTSGNTRTFTTNHVQSFPSIPLPLTQFVYIPPSQVLGQLQQMLGWGFYIDSYRDINFFDTQTVPSPLPNNTLDADDLFNGGSDSVASNWVDLKITEDVSQLKNRVYISGIYVAQSSSYTENIPADGTSTVYTLGYQPPDDISKITVNVGGTLNSNGTVTGGTYYQIAQDLIDGAPGGPTEPDTVYVNFTNQTIRFGTAIASGTSIIVTYYPMGPTVVTQQNTQSQQYMAGTDGTDGIYEYNRMDPSLSAELPTLAKQRATMTLNKYAMPYITGSFTSYLSGWRVGMWFTFNSQRRFQGEYNGKSFFVIRVRKTIVKIPKGGDWMWKYDIQFASVPFSF